MHAEGTRQSLESILTQEVHCSEHLLASLDAEGSALTQRDMDALQSTTQEKLQHTQRLEELEQQREALVTGLGFANDQDGMRRCLRSFSDHKALLDLWQQLLANIDRARNGNLANGGILESNRHYAEQTLRMLRGQSATPALYDPSGDTASELGQRELGEA